MRPYVILFVCLSLFALYSCTNDKTIEVPDVPNDTCTNSGSDVMSYSLHIVPILTTYCTDPTFGSCHQPLLDGGSGFDFTTYDGFHASVDNGQVELRVLGPNADMPQAITYGPTELSDCHAERLQLWIDQGAPNN